MEIKEILTRCDHTLLATTATWEDIRKICDDGMTYGTASVCIPPSFVKRAKEYVGDKLCICTVIGFPNGYNTTAVKCFEAKEAIAEGADEIDMVINLGDLKDGRDAELLSEIKAIKAACGDHILKVIIETCQLTEEEKIIAAKWENGTLRMLSAGLEIIEWSEDEKYLVQGQTRPTVVRSKLTEVSVVDIGGNDDALQTVRLYQGNKVLTLAKDEECEHLPLLKLNTPTSADEEGAGNHSNNIQNTFQMNEILQLLGVATENDALAAIKALQEQNAALNLARITDAVDAAVAEKRITADKKEHFINLGKQSGIENLRTTLSMFAPAQKPTDVINANGKQTVALKWGDYDAAQLEALRKENREEYIRLFKENYGYTPNIQ